MGSPRSGTSLLTWLLGSQDQIAVSSEVKRKAWFRVVGHEVVGVKLCTPEQIRLNRQPKFVRLLKRVEKNLFRPLHRVFGPPFHRPHAPGKMAVADFMRFDNPFAICVLRDPHEVVNSIMERGKQPEWAAHRIYESSIKTLYATWIRYPEHVYLIDFDRLVATPEKVVEGICSWIGIEFDPERVSGYTKNYGRDRIRRVGIEERLDHPVFRKNPNLAEKYRELIENGVGVTARGYPDFSGESADRASSLHSRPADLAG